MKLRIRENNVRVRLSQSEIQALAMGQAVEQVTVFSSESRLMARVESSPHAESLTATFENARLTLLLPRDQVVEWAQSDQVAIRGEQAIAGDSSLHLLIEKDFECLHPRAAEDFDTFPNPKR